MSGDAHATGIHERDAHATSHRLEARSTPRKKGQGFDTLPFFNSRQPKATRNYLHHFYHLNLSPNLTVLAGALPSVLVICMKVDEVTLVFGLLK